MRWTLTNLFSRGSFGLLTLKVHFKQRFYKITEKFAADNKFISMSIMPYFLFPSNQNHLKDICKISTLKCQEMTRPLSYVLLSRAHTLYYFTFATMFKTNKSAILLK